MEFVHDEELLKLWIDDFKSSGNDIKEEIENVRGAISNERIWQKGETDQDSIDMREQNIVNLEAYLEWLEEQTGSEV